MPFHGRYLSMKYSRANMGPSDFLKFGGIVAILLVGIYLSFTPPVAIRPYFECPGLMNEDYPSCPPIQSVASLIRFGALVGGLFGTIIYVTKTLYWRKDVREELRSQREPRIILSQEGSNFGDYHRYESNGNYVGVWSISLGWINNAERRSRRCQQCGGEYMTVRNREDGCWYWVQPHEECNLFSKDQWEWYLNYRSEKRRQGWDAFAENPLLFRRRP